MEKFRVLMVNKAQNLAAVAFIREGEERGRVAGGEKPKRQVKNI